VILGNPHLDGHARVLTRALRADSAVQELTLGLNAAQRLAVLRQHDVVVRFLLSDRLVRIHQDEDNDGTEDDGEDTRVIELPRPSASDSAPHRAPDGAPP